MNTESGELVESANGPLLVFQLLSSEHIHQPRGRGQLPPSISRFFPPPSSIQPHAPQFAPTAPSGVAPQGAPALISQQSVPSRGNAVVASTTSSQVSNRSTLNPLAVLSTDGNDFQQTIQGGSSYDGGISFSLDFLDDFAFN